jgi:hypothetical protein
VLRGPDGARLEAQVLGAVEDGRGLGRGGWGRHRDVRMVEHPRTAGLAFIFCMASSRKGSVAEGALAGPSGRGDRPVTAGFADAKVGLIRPWPGSRPSALPALAAWPASSGNSPRTLPSGQAPSALPHRPPSRRRPSPRSHRPRPDARLRHNGRQQLCMLNTVTLETPPAIALSIPPAREGRLLFYIRPEWIRRLHYPRPSSSP